MNLRNVTLLCYELNSILYGRIEDLRVGYFGIVRSSELRLDTSLFCLLLYYSRKCIQAFEFY